MHATPPVIDLQSSVGLTEACERWGVFQLRGHDVPHELIQGLKAHSRRLFELPGPQKAAIMRTDRNPWGFYDRELTKNRRDWKEIFDVGPAYGDAQPQWPETIPGFRGAVARYSQAAHDLALTVLTMIIDTLGVDATEVGSGFDEHTSFLRLNFYPVCKDPAPADAPTVPDTGQLGISHHTDAGALTILLQSDVEGLQVLHDGRWITVPVVEDALTVNIGDVVQVWSNDRFSAPVHRVLANRERQRFSCAYFLNPSVSYSYAPLTDDPPRYRAVPWKEFRERRAAGDYADVGSEVQISDYALRGGALSSRHKSAV